jgi:predicted enzyme related to lactoylglutathione lyase
MDKGRITGIGGVFVASKNPEALAGWYHDVLGLSVEGWGGALFRSDAPGHPAVTTWAAMPADGHFAPSSREMMLNFAVDDLDAFLALLEAKHVPILNRQEEATGRFAWIMDPDGTRIELWEATPASG